MKFNVVFFENYLIHLMVSNYFLLNLLINIIIQKYTAQSCEQSFK